MKTKRFLVVVSFMFFILTMGALPPGAICAEQIVLNWAGFLPKTVSENVDFQVLFIDKVNQKNPQNVTIYQILEQYFFVDLIIIYFYIWNNV